MIASGCVFGSRTTFAIRVPRHRLYRAGWQVLHAAEPAYSAALWPNATPIVTTKNIHRTRIILQRDLLVTIRYTLRHDQRNEDRALRFSAPRLRRRACAGAGCL